MDNNMTPNQRRVAELRANQDAENPPTKGTIWLDEGDGAFPRSAGCPKLSVTAQATLKALFEESERAAGREAVRAPKPRPELIGLTPDRQPIPPGNDREERRNQILEAWEGSGGQTAPIEAVVELLSPEVVEALDAYFAGQTDFEFQSYPELASLTEEMLWKLLDFFERRLNSRQRRRKSAKAKNP